MSKISLGLLAAATIFVCTIAPAAGQRSGGAADLPDGPGKEVVAQECTKCHGVNNITNSWGFTEKDWRETFDSMVKLPDDKAEDHRRVSRQDFPGACGSAEDRRRARRAEGQHQRMGGADARLAAARSAGRA